MNTQMLKVSLLFGTGVANPDYQELLSGMDNLEFLKVARDPETFLSQHQDKIPDLALIDLDGMTSIPDWLKSVITRLPESEVMVCSHSRDPDFLIRILELRPGGFISLPLKSEELSGHIERVRARRERQHDPKLCHILAVAGSKGGVGVTTVAANLAVALAGSLPGKVLLIDLARPFPHVGQFLDLKSPHTIIDLVNSAENLDPLFLQKVIQRHKSNVDVLLGHHNYNLEFRPYPDYQTLAKIFQALRLSYSWIVLDLGSWVDQLYFQMFHEADQILMLAQLAVPELQNLKYIKALLRSCDFADSKMKIVLNHYSKDYSLGLKDVEKICYQPVSCTLPHDFLPLNEAINQGEPLGELAPRSKLWRGLKNLAAELIAERDRQAEGQMEAKPGLLRRLFQ